MRTRELALVAALAALGACVTNPDPRSPSPEAMAQSAFGGFIVIRTTVGMEVAGELISVETGGIRVLHTTHVPGSLIWVPITDIESAELYKYESDGGFGAWGTLGTLSTISHGRFLGFTAPAWLIATGIVAAVESHHVLVKFPADSWSEFVPWARFPQGMPPGLDEAALILPRSQRPPRPPPPPPPPTPPTIDQVQQQARKDAWVLTQEAAAAARAGDCATATAIAIQVQTMDADFYDTVLIRDVAIARCIATPTPTPPPPMPAPAPPPAPAPTP